MAEGASSSGSGELLDDGNPIVVEETDDDPACHGSLKHPVPETEQLPSQQQQERPRLWQRAQLFWQRRRHGQQQEQPGQQPPQQQQSGQSAQQQQDQQEEQRGQQSIPRQYDRQPAQEERRQQAGGEPLWERRPQRREEQQLAGRQRQRQPWWPQMPDPQPEGGDGTLVKNIAMEGRFTVVSKERVSDQDPYAGRELNLEIVLWWISS